MTSKIVKGYYKNIDKCPKLHLKFEQKDFIMFNSLVVMLFVTIYVKDNRSVSNLDSFLVFFGTLTSFTLVSYRVFICYEHVDNF